MLAPLLFSSSSPSVMMNLRGVLKEFDRKGNYQHSVWSDCLLLPDDHPREDFHALVVSESHRLSHIILDVHRRLIQLHKVGVSSTAVASIDDVVADMVMQASSSYVIKKELITIFRFCDMSLLMIQTRLRVPSFLLENPRHKSELVY